MGDLPKVLAQPGRGRSDRAKGAPRELLQRSLFVTEEGLFKARHVGVPVDLRGYLGI